MQYKVNARLLFWTLGIFAALAALLSLLHDFQVRRNSQGIKTQAEKALQAGQEDRALQFYAQYLSFQPGDLGAQLQYGLILEKIGSTFQERIQSARILDQVVRQDPENAKARFRLVHLLLSLDRLQEAIDHLHVLEKTGWEEKGVIEHLLGWCYEARREYPEARQWFAAAIARNPANIPGYILLAQVLESTGEPEETAKTMDLMIQENPKNAQAYLARSRFYQAQDDSEKAEKDLLEAQKLDPSSPSVILAVSEWDQTKGKFDSGRKLLKAGIVQHPRNVALYKALAGLEMNAGKTEEAQKILREGLYENPLGWELLVLLTDLLIDAGQLKEAEENVKELRKSQCPQALADYLQARLGVERNQWTESVSLLERVRNELGANSEWASRIHALLGLCYERTGDTEQQLASFRKAVNLEPHWTAARFGLGTALLASGRVDDALSELEAVAKHPSAPGSVYLMLARSLLLKNLRLPEGGRNWPGVIEVLVQAEKRQPDSYEIPLLRAEIQAAQGFFKSAHDILTKALKTDPRQPAFHVALADLAARRKQPAEAAQILLQAEKELGDRIDFRLARVRLAGSLPEPQARKELVQAARNIEGLDLDARTRLWRELADAWHRLGDYAQAEILWKQIAREQDRDLRSRFLLFEHALQTHEIETARTLLQEIRKIEGDQGVLWRYCFAALQVADARGDGKRLQKARAAVEDLIRQRQQRDWARLPLLLARIDELEGKFDQARDHYQKAFDLGERQPRVVYRLLQLLMEHRFFANANVVLTKFEENQVLSPDFARLGAEIALVNNDPARAVALAKKAAPADSRDYRDYLWLGRILHAAGKLEEAEETFRAGTQVGGHTPDTWVALVEELALQGKHGEAEKLIASLPEKLPEGQLLLTQARCYEVMGELDLAEKKFQEALKQQPENFILLGYLADFYRHADQFLKAEPILRQLLDVASAAPGENLARARRQLAILLSKKGLLRDFQLALDLLAENVRSRGESLADRRARALVLGMQPERRLEAIQAFEELNHRQPASPDEMFWLAHLLELAEDHVRARGIVLDLLLHQPDNPQFLAFYINSLLRDEILEDAQAYFQRLEKREPASTRTMLLREGIRKAKATRT